MGSTLLATPVLRRPLSRQRRRRRMRKKGNYLNTKRVKERKNNRKELMRYSFRETRISIQKSAVCRADLSYASSVRRFFQLCAWPIVATDCRCRSLSPHKFDIPQNALPAAFYPSASVSLSCRPFRTSKWHVSSERATFSLALTLRSVRTQFTICQPSRDPFSMC